MTRGLTSREDERVGLESIGGQLPFPVKGIDSDNDSVFINDTLTQYCAERGIEFTRSRPYRKNDRAWIEQKNGAVVRHFAGHDRYSGPVAGQTMPHLYGGDIVINANADIIGLTADTAIDITADTYTARGQLHHLPLALHAVTSTRGVFTHPTSEGTRCWPMPTPTWCWP